MSNIIDGTKEIRDMSLESRRYLDECYKDATKEEREKKLRQCEKFIERLKKGIPV